MNKVIFTDRQNDFLNIYLRDIRKYPLMDDSVIRQLIAEYQSTGDLELRDRILQSNLRYVISVAKIKLDHIQSKNKRRRIDIMDLISEGNLGLLKAIDHYNPELPIVFISYATYWIKKYINKFIQQHGDAVYQPDNFSPITDFDNIYQFGRPDSYFESDDEPQTYQIHVTSIDASVAPDGKLRTLEDTIALPDDPLADTYRNEQIRELIYDALDTLSEREATILRLSYGIGDSNHPSDGVRIDDEDIADMLDISSAEHVRQIREHAQRKLANRIDINSLS